MAATSYALARLLTLRAQSERQSDPLLPDPWRGALCTRIKQGDDFTKATVTPAWSGARPMEISSWLWFSPTPLQISRLPGSQHMHQPCPPGSTQGRAQ
jgi:hypothetical protein